MSTEPDATRAKGYTPHPFVEFPLWGLKQALRDHDERVRGTETHNEARYRQMLVAKIAEAESRG